MCKDACCRVAEVCVQVLAHNRSRNNIHNPLHSFRRLPGLDAELGVGVGTPSLQGRALSKRVLPHPPGPSANTFFQIIYRMVPAPFFLRPGTTLTSSPLFAPANLVGRARISRVAARCISQSSASQKAVTFGLNPGRAEIAPADSVGEPLRMIMFGECARWSFARCGSRRWRRLLGRLT